MRSCFPQALVTVILGCLVETAYADDDEPTSKDEAAVQAMTKYSPPLQRYTVQGLQPDVRPSCTSPETQDFVWNALHSSSDVYVNKWHDCCDPQPEECCHFFLEGGVYYMKPHVENNPGYIIQHRDFSTGVPVVGSAVIDLNYHPDFAPRVSLGVSSDSGLGLRTTWFHFDEGAPTAVVANLDPTKNTQIETPPILGVPGFNSPGVVASKFGIFNDHMRFDTHLDTHVWDWETTQAFHPGGWCLVFAEGVRYTYLSQNYEAFRTNAGIGTLGTSRVVLSKDMDLVRTGHNFNGAGPTGEFEVRHALGDTGLALYGTGRESVLFGRGRTRSFQATLVTQQIIPKTGKAVTTSSTVTERGSNGHDDVLPITDFEFGIEWSKLVGHARLFVQTGVVASEWTNAGSGTSESGDLSFFGMNVTMGVSF